MARGKTSKAAAVETADSAAPPPAAPPPGGAGLVVDSIGKRFGDRQVVKNVSLRLARGEVAGLLGPNGAGKTTCFYMVTGLIPVDSGTISLDGADITALPMYQRARLGVGYLPQEASIFRGLTVEQNVMAVVEMRVADRVVIDLKTGKSQMVAASRGRASKNRVRAVLYPGSQN